jgi:hypothetical protein
MTCRLIIPEHIEGTLVFKDCDRDQVVKAHKEFQVAAQQLGLNSPDQLTGLGYEQLKQIDWGTVRQAVDQVHCLLPDCSQYMAVSGNPFDLPPNQPQNNPVNIPGFIYFVIVCLAVYFTAQAYDLDLSKLRSLLNRNGKRT